MIFTLPAIEAPVDQGDVIDGCPILRIANFIPDDPIRSGATCVGARVVVLTQTCDLIQGKTTQIVVAILFPAQELVEKGLIKAADVRGSIRMGRVFGWYFLPKSTSLGLPESILDFRSLHTVPLAVLEELVQQGRRVAHLESPYREHLAKHFSDTYSRIGLPMPYETD
jgi:hypothetical protein